MVRKSIGNILRRKTSTAPTSSADTAQQSNALATSHSAQGDLPYDREAYRIQAMRGAKLLHYGTDGKVIRYGHILAADKTTGSITVRKRQDQSIVQGSYLDLFEEDIVGTLTTYPQYWDLLRDAAVDLSPNQQPSLSGGIALPRLLLRNFKRPSRTSGELAHRPATPADLRKNHVKAVDYAFDLK